MLKAASPFLGYFNDPALSNRTVDSEGWIRTGDIGRTMAGGQLQVCGKKESVIRLKGGERVFLSDLEMKYQSSEYINQIFVYGDRL